MHLSRLLFLTLIFFSTFGGVRPVQVQSPDTTRGKRLTSTMDLLAHGNEKEQGQALHQLVFFSLPPDQGVPLFQAHIQRHTHTQAEALKIAYALEGLATYGPQARAALPDIIRLMDEIGTVEGAALYEGQTYRWLTNSLSKIGPDDPDVVEAFKRALERCIANPEKLDDLTINIARAFENMGCSAHIAVPLLTRALDLSSRAAPDLANALSHMMPEAAFAVPTLIRTLQAKQPREAVVDALGTIGPAAKSALPALNRTLKLPDPQIACKTFAAIARIEGQPKLTLSESLTILKHIDKRRISAIYAAFTTVRLQSLHSEAAPPILAHIVARRKEMWLRRTAIETLAEIGPEGDREAGVALIQAAAGKDPVIKLYAWQTFRKFGTSADQVIPELIELLRTNDDRNIRSAIVSSLIAIGPKAISAVPTLLRFLREGSHGDVNSIPVGEIGDLLAKIGPIAPETVPALTALLQQYRKDDNLALAYTRSFLLWTIMQIGVTPDILPIVRDMLQTSQPENIASAAHAVVLLGPQAADMIPFLIRPLQPDFKDIEMTSHFNSNPYAPQTTARNECMRALAIFGPAAKAALPLLRTYADIPVSQIPRRSEAPLHLKYEAQRTIRAILQLKETR